MSILEIIKEITAVIEWPEAILLLVLLMRKEVKGIVTVLKEKMSNASEISIGKDGITIKQLKEMLEKTKEETVGMLAQGVGKQKAERKEITKHVVEDQNDPLKLHWNGNLEDRGKRISATVEEMPGSGLYRLKIFVRSIFPQEPLKGKVKFYLHPTFNNPEPVVEAIDGEAYLQLVSYGSFTLGAETEDGAKLKLDLATDVPGVSETFKNS